MKQTEDQRDLEQVLEYAIEAREVAYDLFSRRLKTQRNASSFILLREAFVRLKEACRLLERGVKQATESRSSDQPGVGDEMALRSGRWIVVPESEAKARHSDTPATVLPFRRAQSRKDQGK